MKTITLALTTALLLATTVTFAQTSGSVSGSAFASSSGNGSASASAGSFSYSSSGMPSVAGGYASSTVNGVTRSVRSFGINNNSVSSSAYSNAASNQSYVGVHIFTNPGTVMTPTPGMYR